MMKIFMTKYFFLLEIIDMKSEPSKKIDLNFEFNNMKVQSCNFNLKEELIVYCIRTIIKDKGDDNETDKANIVCVYSIQTKVKCQRIYMISKKAEVISISKHNKIWLNFNDYIHEWNLHTGDTTIISINIGKVIINF